MSIYALTDEPVSATKRGKGLRIRKPRRDGYGVEYPIKMINRDASINHGEMVCEYYGVEKPHDFTTKIARKVNVGGVVRICSACRTLVHKAAKVCPHCFADFVEAEYE